MLLIRTAFGQTKFQKDFSFYWQTVNDNFAYFGKQKTNWDKVGSPGSIIGYSSLSATAPDEIKSDDIQHTLTTWEKY